MKKLTIILLPATLLAACHAEKRYLPPPGVVPDTAQLIVSSNRSVNNQWIRLHGKTCDWNESRVLGALNNETDGWPRTGASLTSIVDPGDIRLGMAGSVSEAIINKRGVIEAFIYSSCYSVARFTARAEHIYHVKQVSEILPDAHKAICGYEIREQSPNGVLSTIVPELSDCTDHQR